MTVVEYEEIVRYLGGCGPCDEDLYQKLRALTDTEYFKLMKLVAETRSL